MPQIGANFQFTSRQPNFERDQFDTIAHMAACTVCDEGHKCYCLENQKTYEFTSVDSNGNAIEPNETTGYWHEFSSGGNGDVTGATIGSGASAQNVTKVGGVLQFPAYPIVLINKIKVDGASDDLPINDGRVVIPSTPVKGIKTNGGTDLTPDSNGKVTLPPIPADPSSRLTNIENTLQQIANAEPIVIPASAVELPTSANSTIIYDPDDTYVMNISGTQIATVHYPYEHSTNSYLAFKAIDRDLYYVYQLTNAANNTYTFVEQHTYDELSHSEAKAVFEAGKYAVKQIIDVRHTGNPIPEGYFKHGIPSVFVTPDGYPLRYNQIKENNVWYILLKCDENNKIFKYSASNNKWSLVSGGCYTKSDTITGANYNKYDKFFDRKDASDVDFDNTGTGLSGTTVQAVIGEVANKLGYVVNPQAIINTNPTKNEYYDFTANAISSLDVHDISVTNTNEILVLFLTSSNGCSLILSTSQRIIGSTSLANSQVYIMSILRGVICLVEAPAYVQVTSLSSTPESE